MKFSCEKYLLQSAVTIASRAAASKSPIPALEGLLLQAGDDLRVTGYDLKEGIYTNIGAEIEEAGSIVVGARLFEEGIPDGQSLPRREVPRLAQPVPTPSQEVVRGIRRIRHRKVVGGVGRVDGPVLQFHDRNPEFVRCACESKVSCAVMYTLYDTFDTKTL